MYNLLKSARWYLLFPEKQILFYIIYTTFSDSVVFVGNFVHFPIISNVYSVYSQHWIICSLYLVKTVKDTGVSENPNVNSEEGSRKFPEVP